MNFATYNEIIDDDAFLGLNLPELQAVIHDTRPISQVTLILFDNSASMMHQFAKYAKFKITCK